MMTLYEEQTIHIIIVPWYVTYVTWSTFDAANICDCHVILYDVHPFVSIVDQ